MKQITEDYVSFEIAKLLKEKGFDGECQGYYEVPTKLYSQRDVNKQLNVLPRNWNEYNKECVVCEYVSISTYQMAMKWLREVHNLCIAPYAAAFRYGFTIDKADTGSNIGNEKTLSIPNYSEITTWEEACEAGIKYCLENLI